MSQSNVDLEEYVFMPDIIVLDVNFKFRNISDALENDELVPMHPGSGGHDIYFTGDFLQTKI